MKLEGTWSASSSESIDKSNELINMTGRWNIGINVYISIPYEYYIYD